MDASLLTLIGLRASALAMTNAGQVQAGVALYLLADAIEAGRATDEHMRLVAEKLKAGSIELTDWDDVARRISGDQDRLHSQR